MTYESGRSVRYFAASRHSVQACREIPPWNSESAADPVPQQRAQLADKIKLVFEPGYAILLLRIDERKIYPVRVTEVLLLRISTPFPSSKKAAEDLPVVLWPDFALFRLRLY